MRTSVFLLMLIISAAISGAAFCDDKQPHIDINVTAAFEPAQGIGLILTESAAVQTHVTAINRISTNTVIVSIPYSEGDLSRDAMATAILIGADGQTAYGDVRPVFSPDSRESFLKVPQCAPEKISETALQGQVSLLESLIEVRSARRGVAQVKVAQILTGEFLTNLSKLEAGFGLRYSSPLSPELTPVELIDRLSRLTQVVSAAKPRQDKASK